MKTDTPTLSPPSHPAPSDVDDQAELEPEVADLQRRLAAIPTEWIGDELRSALANQAKAAARQRSLVDRRDALDRTINEALAEDNEERALIAAQRLAAVALVVGRVSAIEVDSSLAQEALRRAQEGVLSALQAAQLTQPAYLVERGQWQRLPDGLRLDVRMEPPHPTDLDRQAVRVYEALAARIDRQYRAWLNWQREAAAGGGSVDLWTALGMAAATCEHLDGLADQVAEVNALITKANRARETSGETWHLPPGVAVSAD